MTKKALIFLAVAATLSAQKSRPQRVVNFTAGGTANAITGTPSPALTAYSDLSTTPLTQVCFTATATSTGTVTVNLNALGAKALKKVTAGSISDAGANDLINGQVACAVYLSSPDYLMLTTPSGNLGASGGGSETYHIYAGCRKDNGGSRACEFSNAGGSITAAVVGTTNASEIVAFVTTASAGEKVGMLFTLPITPTTWTATVELVTSATTTLDFTFSKVCMAPGAAATNTLVADGSAVSLTPASSSTLAQRVTKTLTVGSCAAGDLVNLVVSTNAVATAIVSLATTIQ